MEYVTGLLYEYYHICQRKTWLFSTGIAMESENDNVQIGKLIDENSFSREHKHIIVDGITNIDFLKDKTVYEIKKSSAEKEAAIMQIKYYLFVLHSKGVEASGELRVPKEKYTETVELTADDLKAIPQTIAAIMELIAQPVPPPPGRKQGFCKKCAYYELCFI